MDKPNYYAIISAEVRYDKNLTPFSKLLYAEITALCNKEGYCWATNAYFAKNFEVREITIQRAITLLINNGHIIREIHNINSNESKRFLRLAITNAIPSSIKNDIPTPINIDTHNSIKLNNKFNIFWDLITGRKRNKADAERAFDKIKTDLTPEQLAEKYNELLQSREEKFVPYPQKWLKNEGWKEEIIYEKPKNTLALQFSNKAETFEGIHEEDIQEYLDKARKENNTEMVAIYEKELRRMKNE